MKWFLFIVSFFQVCLFALDDFEIGMGKGTSHWRHVTEKEDEANLNWYQDLYEKNFHFLEKRASQSKIPQVLHLIWLGPRQFPRTSVDHLRSWIGKNPHWKVKFWTDRPRPAPCQGVDVIVFEEYPFPNFKGLYPQSQNWGEKSDLLRFEILYYEGGAYADHDARCLVSFDALHGNFDFYCGLEAPHVPFAENRITAGIGVLGSRPKHPTIAAVIQAISSHWDQLGQKYSGADGYSQTQLVMERTYLPLTLCLRNTVDREGNVDIVLPASYFFAKPGIHPLYSQHFFANSWADIDGKDPAFEKQTEKQLSTIYSRLRKVTVWSIGTLSLNLAIIWIGFIVYRKQRTVS